MEGYYIHFHGNDGILYLKLADGPYFICWEIDRAVDALYDVKGGKAKRVFISELPDEITLTPDFGRFLHRIREVYKLH